MATGDRSIRGKETNGRIRSDKLKRKEEAKVVCEREKANEYGVYERV